MATQTTNYHLVKPDYTDAADINVINTNMTTIDTQMKANADNITTHTNEIAKQKLVSGAISITATGTINSSITGMTANHYADFIGFYSDSGCTTPISPCAAFKWTTSSGKVTLSVTRVDTTCYVKMSFAYKGT